MKNQIVRIIRATRYLYHVQILDGVWTTITMQPVCFADATRIAKDAEVWQ